MMRTIKSGLTVGMLVAALALTGGCGDNDNSFDDNDNAPGPVETATPTAPEPTPVATNEPTAEPTDGVTQQTVTFNLTATGAVEGYRISVTYPTAKGSFTGSADQVGCTLSTGNGSFVANDQDNGTLLLVNGNPTALTFPQTVACTFDATTPLEAGDIVATVDETTQNGGQTGDPNAVAVAVTIE